MTYFSSGDDDSFPVPNREDLDKAKKFIQDRLSKPNADAIRTYEELLQKAMEKIKDKQDTLMAYNPASVNIPMPPGMEIENYHDMNLVAGHRIGWDYKQEYLAKLAELYAEGFLTDSEYEKRFEWVNAAQTSEQIDIAFTDLQRSLMTMKVNEYLPEVKKNSGPVVINIIVMIAFIFGVISNALAGNVLAAGILFTGTFIILLMTIRRMKNI